jgi:hypothetical protein
MGDWALRSPVVFLIFNRPDTTAKVFEAIRKARPQKLLIVADGPRQDRPGEVEKCDATRKIVERIDWDCEALRNYSTTNLGCRTRVASGLDWVFEQVEEAIILEDDCLPHPTFFRYCDELLERYRTDQRVASIRGDNWPGGALDDYSYRFTIYPSIWGWATWRRVWRNYDVDMKEWPSHRSAPWLRDWIGTGSATKEWQTYFDKTYRKENNTWDFQFVFAAWCQSQYSIVPAVNLISNIGVGLESTHVMRDDNPRLNRPAEEIAFPLKHPSAIVRYRELDAIGETQGAILEHELLKAVRVIIQLLEWLRRRKLVRWFVMPVVRVIRSVRRAS